MNNEVIKMYQLTHAQKRIWFNEILFPNTPMHNVAECIKFNRSLSSDFLKKAVNIVIQKNDSLRMKFTEKDGETYQYVESYKKMNIPFLDFSSYDNAQEKFTEWAKDEVKKIIYKENEFLFKFFIYKLNEKNMGIFFVVHHIIIDGWSDNLILKEIGEIYEKLEKAEEIDTRVEYSYLDYLKDENEYLNSDEFVKNKEFWCNKFSQLNEDNLYSNPQSFKARNKNFLLSKERTHKLKEFLNSNKISLNRFFLSILAVYANKRYEQKDMILGSAIHNRNSVSEKNTVGMFTGTLPLRIILKENCTYKELLNIVNKEIKDCYNHKQYPYDLIMNDLDIKKRGYDNLFKFCVNYYVFQSYKNKNLQFSMKAEKYHTGYENLPMQFFIKEYEESGDIEIEIGYRIDDYEETEIIRMYEALQCIINKVMDNPNVKVSDIEIISQEEKKKILYEFNNTLREYPKNKTVKELFEEIVESYSEKTALVCNGRKINYKKLNEKANQIAHLLRKKGVSRETIVPILCDRSMETVIGVLGIVKAGAAYLPIDEEYPLSRIEYMIEDSVSSLIIGKKNIINKLRERNLEQVEGEEEKISLELIDIDSEEILKESSENIQNINCPQDLIYVIYTSGSTGKAKGVCVEHKNVVRLVKNQNFVELSDTDKILQTGSIVFDASTFEIWGALLNGLTVCIENKDFILDPKRMKEYIRTNNVTVMFMTTALFHQICNVDVSTFSNLKTLLVGGEVLDVNQLNKFKAYNDWTNFSNIYGPTENTTYSTSYLVKERSWDKEKKVPIGKPIGNSTVYIMSKDNKLLPIGVPGELCVGGDGVARGYLNRDELTKEKFIENPYIKGDILYKTGDLARWLSDGNVEFLGRIDHQVKIRGFRIELGEVEKELLKHEKVKEAIVIDRKDEGGNAYLCGYVVGECELSSKKLKEFLKKTLSSYMVPSYIIQLENMPLNHNGKIDRKALPKPEVCERDIEYIAPRNKIEERLSGIWSEVLSKDKIGVQDNFFELGGHSLKAVNMVSKIHKEFNFKIAVSEIFDKPTIEELGLYLKNSEELSCEIDKLNYKEIELISKNDYYETTQVQKRMFAINQRNKESISYNMPFAYLVESNFDINRFKKAVKKLVDRHEALRTSFHIIDGNIVQKVHDKVDFQIESIKINDKFYDSKRGLNREINKFIKPFNLEKGILIRVGVIELQDASVVIMDIHHIICDGVSIGIILEELSALYEVKYLEEVKIQYKDFANWQNKLYEKGLIENQGEYWLERFKGEIPILNMPTDYKRPARLNYEGSNLRFKLNEELVEQINNITKKTGVTNYMFYLAAFNILLAKYSNQEDIIVGTPSVGRTHASVGNVVGMFVNTLALRNCPSSEKTFNKFLQEIKENSIKAFENQDYDLEMLIDKLNIKKEKNRNPLFDVMFSVENFQFEEFILGDSKLTQYDLEYNVSKFDISLNVLENENNVYVNFQFNTSLYKEETIKRISKHFNEIIKAVTTDLEIKLKDIDMISKGEQKIISDEFNRTDVEYPKNKTIHEVFENQVLKTPHKVAVKFKDSTLTYKELDERANSLARLLREKGVTKETRVAIMVERSPFMITGILAILKAGGAYVPIDPEYPEDRKNYMLKDSNSQILLTQKHLSNSVSYEKEIIDIEDERIYELENGALENINDVEDLIYIIYTSGTTGKPKGVMVEHRNVVNASYSWERNYDLETMDVKLLQVASFSFDVFVADFCRTLLNGGQMIICPKEARLNPESLYDLITKNEINIFNSTPGLVISFMDYIYENNLSVDTLQLLIVGADICSVEDFNRLNERYRTKMRILNCYGITEATIDSSFFELREGEKVTTSNVPIGKPIDNTKFYLLDKNKKLLPIGVYGELYIGGHGVARGYLNNEELTQEKFIENPYKKGERLYKTGDMARWLPDGNIDFIGRIDNQVKIRGYRIELGEIENQLLKDERIDKAAVVVKEFNNGANYLCGFVAGDTVLTEGDIKEYLKGELPDYMIPTVIINLHKMPLTQNGKVDRKLLSEMEVKVAEKDYVAPRTPLEENLAEMWGEVLEIEKVSIKDNFFEIGGHSLKAINLISKIHKGLNLKVSVSDIFEYPTIEEISAYLQRSKLSSKEDSVATYKEIEPAPQKDYYEASAVQKRMYVIHQKDVQSTNYNMPSIYMVKGVLDKNKLEEALRKLIKRHEAFRTSFHVVNGEIVQKIEDKVVLNLEHINSKDRFYEDKEYIHKEINAFIRPFDLSKAPLIRAAVIELANGQIFVMDMHHIAVDGVSSEIIMRDIAELYEGKELKDVKIQYKDFSYWQNKLYDSDLMKNQENYWLEQFKSEIPVLNMPSDYIRPSVQNFEGSSKPFEIDKVLSEKINKIIAMTGVTKHMFFLSVFNILLSKYSGQEDIVVGTPAAGRTHGSLENTVGMFVNTLPMRNKPEGNKSFKEFLNELKENSIRAFENQDYDLEKLIEKLNIKQDTSRNPLFDVLFSIQDFSTQNCNIGEASLTSYSTKQNTAKFDLALFLFENNKVFSGVIEYRTRLYKKETIERLINNFKNLLNEIAYNIDTNIGEINIITKEEKDIIINNFNNTEKEYPKNKTIKELFEEQVKRTPHNAAVYYENISLSYYNLNKRANQLARVLRKRGIINNTPVGILMERSIETIIAVMSIVKSGGVCLPISVEYPENRIKYILEDSGARLVITNRKFKDRIYGNHSLEIIDIHNKESFKDENTLNLSEINSVDDLSYIIYTSGTTGKPKGVMQTHKTINNLVHHEYKCTNIDFTEKVLQFTTIGFDVFFQEVFSTLLKGGELCIINDDNKKDVQSLCQFIRDNNIKNIFLPTAYLKFIFSNSEYSNLFPRSINHIITAGERLIISDLLKDYLRETNIQLHNHYGPSETHVSTTYIIDGKKEVSTVPPIGEPIINSKCHILNKNLKLQPIGVPGELYISGHCLAKGYLNNKELTEERFIENPFIQGENLYKTGDLAKWLPDGNIEFLGRIDHQVKIRGFRVELGEIENELLEHKDIKEAVVIVRKDKENNNYLCAYIVNNKEELSAKEIKEFLRKSLPTYMIPAYIIQLDKMLYNDNGKIDRKALPQPQIKEREYTKPRNDIEEKLLKIWMELLNIENIGVEDNFFELGGHSLNAVNLVSKIQKEFNLNIKVSDIFNKPTIEELSLYLQEMQISMKEIAASLQEKYISEINEIQLASPKEYYEASAVQKRMYAINQVDTKSVNYNMPFVYVLKGEFDKNKFEKTLKELIRRHEALRTSFHVVDGLVVQKVHERVCFKLDSLKIDGKLDEREEDIHKALHDFIKPFDLSKSPLIRSAIIGLEDANILIIDMHHIISDGVSTGIIIGDIMDLYEGKDLEEVKVQYKDFSTWQNNLYHNGIMLKEENYWLQLFNEEIPVLNMATDFKRPLIQSYEGDNVSFELDEDLRKKINNIITETGATEYMFFLAAYNILLYKYSGQEDIIIGTPAAGRTNAALENTVGMFVNTLPSRNKIEPNKSFRDFLQKVKENSLSAFENQNYDLGELIEKLEIKKDSSRNPLFDVMFTLQNVDIKELKLEGLSLMDYEIKHSISKLDLSLIIYKNHNKIQGVFEYKTGLYKKETIERLKRNFQCLLCKIIENLDLVISEIDVLTKEEKDTIINKFNNTKLEYPKDKTVKEIFEKVAIKAGDKTAVVCNGIRLSYRELNEKANKLAYLLKEKGVSRDAVVAVYADKSVETIISILAVIKAGGAYLPIDEDNPQARIRYMIEDSGSRILLGRSELLNDLKLIDIEIEMIGIRNDELLGEESNNLDNINSPRDLAYVIYTSGSTGRPKGVSIENISLINLVINERQIKVEESDKVLQVGSLSFDASVQQIWVALLNGIALHLEKKRLILQFDILEKYIKENNITIMHVPTTFFNQLSQDRIEALENIKYLMAGGDVMSSKQVSRVTKRYKNTKLINGYGPTENTVLSTSYMVHGQWKEEDSVPIGKPVSNTKAYIMDKNNTLVPIGVIGELCVGGDGLARGYLNKEELTKEKFIENPYVKGERIYKTGDLARWLPDGNIEFIGRIDHQVKIRGYRVEIGEIEKVFLKYNKIKEVVILDRKDKKGNKYLCAYIVPKESIELQELREYLSEELPSYMIPSYFIEIEKMPITVNGKIDRKALPMPEGRINTGEEYVAPRNKKEREIAAAWEEVLGVREIGIYDNFFNLGGDSIKAIRVVSRLSKRFKITINHIYEYQNINKLVSRIDYCREDLLTRISRIKDEIAITKEEVKEDSISSIPKDITCEYELYENQLKKYEHMNLSNTIDYKNILLTGSTGYAGVYILRELLNSTNSDLYLLVRGKDLEEAKNRVLHKLRYYFGEGFYKKYSSRIEIIKGDISKKYLGLEKRLYDKMCREIDCIINSAAYVKHYGNYEDFYNINVEGTRNLLHFAKEGKKKDFNHVSTISVGEGNIKNKNRVIFTEFHTDIGQKSDNYYIQTKLQGEKLVQEAGKESLKTKIFRLGNVTFNSKTGTFQENIEDNAFYKTIKSFIKLNNMPCSGEKIFDFSFVDQIAQVIVTLFNRTALENEIFHLENPNRVSTAELAEMLKEKISSLKSSTFEEFLDFVSVNLDNDQLRPYIDDILMKFGLSDENKEKETQIIKSSKKTILVLEKLGFTWKTLNNKDIDNMIDYCKKVNYLS